MKIFPSILKFTQKNIVFVSILFYSVILSLLIGSVCLSNYGPKFEEWQTLIAAVFATAAAIATIVLINMQINEGRRLEEERRERECRAARSVLPLALSLITQYGTNCMRAANLPNEQRLEAFRDPRTQAIDDDIIEPFKECVRYADDDAAKAIFKLLSWLQIQNARFRGYANQRRISDRDAIEAVLDAAKLNARATNLFWYGRNYGGDDDEEREEGTFDPPNAGDVRSAAWHGLDYRVPKELDEVIERRFRQVQAQDA